MSHRLKAQSLITASRLDIVGKIPLGRALAKQQRNDWARRLFRECLLQMRPSGRFDENGDKSTLLDYEWQYEKLLKSLRSSGFDEQISRVPLAKDGSLLNGAHRIAACTLLGLDVTVERSNRAPEVYDWKFFRNAGMPGIYLDELAYLFAQNVGTTRALVVSNLEDLQLSELRGKIGELCSIVFEKTVELTEIGVRRNIELMYSHLEWYDQSLLEKMVRERYRSSANKFRTTVFLIDNQDDGDHRLIKEELRGFLGNNQFERQIHGTDNWIETMSLAEVWTNANSLKFMNQTPIGSEQRILRHLKEELEPNLGKVGDYVIDSGGSLEFHGYKTTQDIDHICTGDAHKGLLVFGDCHNEHLPALGLEPEDIVFFPANHVRWGGFKFTTVDYEFKRLRNLSSSKSSTDLGLLLESTRNQKQSNLYFDTNRAERARRWQRKSVLQVRLDIFLERLPSGVRAVVGKVAAWLRRLG